MYKIIGANQVEYGPITAEQLRQWIAEGRINAQTLAQAEGETGWRPITSFPEFAASFPAAPAASHTPTPGVPGAPQGAMSDSGRAVAKSQMTGPAIGLMITAGLGIAFQLFGLLNNLMGAPARQKQLETLEQQFPQWAPFMQSYSNPSIEIVSGLVGIVIGIFIIYAAVKMKNLQNFGLSMAASIVAMIPCCSPCCCIGIPIGIWALVMLNKAEVKAYFT